MVKEADSTRRLTRRNKELAELRNQADSLIYSADRTLKDLGDKATDAERQAIEDGQEASHRSDGGRGRRRPSRMRWSK